MIGLLKLFRGGSLYVLLGALALASLAAWRAASLVHTAARDSYSRGVEAGVLQERDAWRSAQAAAFREAQEQSRVAQARDLDAVKRYVAAIARRKPQVEIVDRERVVYVQSTAGRAPGLDADGVRLIQANRRSLDWPGDSGASSLTSPVGAVPLSTTADQ